MSGTTSSQYIDAAQFYLFTSQWECITVQSNGTNWNIIGKVT